MPPASQLFADFDATDSGGEASCAPSLSATATVNTAAAAAAAPPTTATDILRHAGGFGRYQFTVVAWGSLVSALCGMHVMSNFFVAMKAEGKCTDAAGHVMGGSDGGVGATMLPACADDGWCLNETHARSALLEFGGCSPPSWMRPLVGAAFFLGWFCAGLPAGRISDTHGRRVASFVLCVLVAASFATATATQSMPALCVVSFVHGVFTGSLTLTSYVLSCESVEDRYQGIVGTVILAAFSVGETLLVPMAYALPHWRHFILAVCAVTLLALPFLASVRESPRFYAATGNAAACTAAYAHIARTNGVGLSAEKEVAAMAEHAVAAAAADQSAAAARPAPRVTDLVAFPRIARRTLVMCFCWFTCALSYYGLNYAAGDLGSNVYTSSVLVAAVELPTYLFQGYAVEAPWIGRKKTCIAGFVIGGVACVACFVLSAADAPAGLTTTLAMAGKMGVSAAFAVAYIWGAELFPTEVRTTGMGASTAAARVGGLLAPFVAASNKALPIFGALAAVAGACCMLLPETLNRPETQHDTLLELQREAAEVSDHPMYLGDDDDDDDDEGVGGGREDGVQVVGASEMELSSRSAAASV